MFKYLTLAALFLTFSTADAQSVKTEFVTGDGLIFSHALLVNFAIDASQRDPDDPVGWMYAEFDSFPQHLVMTFESTGFSEIAVDKRTALVTGTAAVVDLRTGFEGEVEFSAVFVDANTQKRQPRSDSMSLTLFLPTGTETYSSDIALGGVEVGKRNR
jgi:hypothetical protein